LISDRTTETLEWANRLDLADLDSLSSIEKPAYYEVRSSDRCNLQCRMCSPASSHRISKEYQSLGWYSPKQKESQGLLNLFDLIDFQQTKKIYVSGGEPMLNADFFKWLEQCEKNGNTNVECLINTNGTKLPLRFRKFLLKFSNLQFIFSIDGYGKDNDYIRWGSDWNNIVDNWRTLINHGKTVCVNTTVSIYNVHKLSKLYRFIDNNFPDTLVHVNLVTEPMHLDVFSFPDKQTALDDLILVRDTACYQNNPLLADNIEFLIKSFEKTQQSDLETRLERFFSFNDALDRTRGSSLVDFDKCLPKWRL